MNRMKEKKKEKDDQFKEYKNIAKEFRAQYNEYINSGTVLGLASN